MTVPRLTVAAASAPIAFDTDVVVLAACPAGVTAQLWAPEGFEVVQEWLERIGFAGGSDELVQFPRLPQATERYSTGAGPRLAVIGLGGPVSPDTLRYAAGSATRQLAGAATVAFALPLRDDQELDAVLEGAALGAYAFSQYRVRSAAGQKPPVGQVIVHADSEHAETLVERATAVAEAISMVKDLVNMPPSDLYPAAFATAAAEHARGLPVWLETWDETQLAADGFGGILGVGQGSTRPPRLVKVSYTPDDATTHLALVGKGITFDSGGLSLKPPTGMVGMKYDMTGAATVLAVTLATARLKLPVRLTAWLCIAENMPSGSAIRPNDVLRIRGGHTVEVLNTDAEGRIVMADGIAAASEEHPDAIIDVATLTGASIVALGQRYTGVMGDEQLVASLTAAAVSTGELLWPMPLPAELRASLNSDVADIANATPGNTAAGMLLAAVFLKEFVGRVGDEENSGPIPWAHLDIAGPSKANGGGYGFTGKGPTGVTVRTLLRLAEELSGGVVRS